ncbi:hypothetical protein TUZN_0020 [Thermoproteus uzoniensis 768-20]|uniref:Methyltransferase FkbM domain-containing protein n=2 Tax=Thermoproteus TaxID=2270 RepID=F2L0X7_THEU7|nr:hypothetical protein TUZN_0020 [Thermoproteus uzoniensis 768-20]
MFGLVEPQWRDYFKEAVKSAKVFIDVGSASDGYYALLSTKFNRKILVVAVEPSPTEYRYLLYNVTINNVKNNILCLNIGLSDQSGRIMIENKNIYLIKLDELVNVLKLDTVDLIKLDVEGAGGKIIAGAVKTIEKFKPIIFFEVHNDDERRAIRKLSKMGYKIYKQPGDMYILIHPSKFNYS